MFSASSRLVNASLVNCAPTADSAAMAAASTALPPIAESQDSDLQPIITQIQKQHDENVQRLQTWIRQPSIAAENRGMQEGCRLMMEMLQDAGFEQVTQVSTDGQPGVFATMDNGAAKTMSDAGCDGVRSRARYEDVALELEQRLAGAHWRRALHETITVTLPKSQEIFDVQPS